MPGVRQEDESEEEMILRWPGCKHSLRNMLAKSLPADYQEFRDVTVGNGPLLPYAKGRVVANDIHPALMDYYRRLQSCPRFIPEVLELRQRSRCPRTRREIFEAMKDLYRQGDGLALLYLTRHGFREQVRSARKDTASFDPGKNGFRPLTQSRLLRYRATIQGVELVCGDYKAVMCRPGTGVVIFIDPPYHLPCARHRSGSLYEYPWQTEDQYRELQQVLVDCPHRFMLTIGNSDLENDLFRTNRWNITEIEYETHSIKGTHSAAIRKHLLVRNYCDDRQRFWMFT